MRVLKRAAAVAAVIIALFLVLNILAGGRFFTASNMLSVLSNSVVTAFIVLGMCFIFTMGITDLSIGSIMILASNAGAVGRHGLLRPHRRRARRGHSPDDA